MGWTVAYHSSLMVEGQEIEFDGVMMQPCGHHFLAVVSDDVVRRHKDHINDARRLVGIFRGSGDLSGANRAASRAAAAQQNFKIAAKKARARYGDLDPGPESLPDADKE